MRQGTRVHRSALVLAAALLTACATSTSRIRTYVEPSLATTEMRRVAILPIRSAHLAPDEGAQLNRGFMQAFEALNPEVDVLGPTEAARALDEAGLAERYSEYLRNFAASGIPDSRALRTIADALGVDGIIQGEIVEVRQRDGEMWHSRGRNAKTSITLKYALLATDGTVLWQSTASGIRHNLTPIGGAPRILDAVSVAQERILNELPALGTR